MSSTLQVGVGVTSHTNGTLATGVFDTISITTGGGGSTATLTPAADAYVRDGTNASSNYGTAATLESKLNNTVNNNRNIYLRFNLTGVGSTISSAWVRIYGRASVSAKAHSLFAVSNVTWGETTITWSNAPAMGTSQGSQSVPLTDAWVEYDVTSYLQAQKNAGATAVSFGLKSDVNAPDTQTIFHSKEGTNDPQLVVTSF
jgi:hypothetical protein